MKYNIFNEFILLDKLIYDVIVRNVSYYLLFIVFLGILGIIIFFIYLLREFSFK